jgi:hypothetical protein
MPMGQEDPSPMQEAQGASRMRLPFFRSFFVLVLLFCFLVLL